MSGKKQSYAVVRFEDAVVSEIPSKWLIDNNTKCWWPPTRNVSTHILKETNPTENWKKYPIQIEAFCDSLAVARKKAEDINYTESEEIPTGRGHRRRNNTLVNEQDGDTSDSDHDKRTLGAPPRLNEDLSISSTGRPPPGSNVVQQIDGSTLPSRNIQTIPDKENTSSNNITKNPPNTVAIPSTSEKTNCQPEGVVQQIDDAALPSRNIQAIPDKENTSSNNITKNPPNTVVIPSTSEKPNCQPEDSSALNKIWKALSEIQLKLNGLGEMIDATGLFTRVDAHEPIKRFLPIKNLEALAQFEEHLSEEDNRKLFESYIKLIGGNGLKDSISRAYKSTFTNEVAVLCSWLGLRKNHRISDSKAINTIKGILMPQFNTNNNHCSVKDFEVISSEWFRHAKQRLNRQK